MRRRRARDSPFAAYVDGAELAFWLVTLWSVVFAHAPASFRHWRVDALWRGRAVG